MTEEHKHHKQLLEVVEEMDRRFSKIVDTQIQYNETFDKIFKAISMLADIVGTIDKKIEALKEEK